MPEGARGLSWALRQGPSPMRVLHVTHQYPPAIGGSEKYIADLSEQLAARGHRVDVFTSRSLDYRTWKDELDPRERLNGVDVFRFRSMSRTRWVWRVLHWSLRHYWETRSRWYEPLILFGGGPLCPGMLAALLSRLPQYDLIHLNCLVYSHAFYGYHAARWRQVPVVTTPHIHSEQKVTYGVQYQLDILQGSDHVIADTEGERAFLLELGLDPGCVTTVGCGIDVASYPRKDVKECRRRLGLPEGAYVMLFLGRQVEYKGLETAVKAFFALRRHSDGAPFSDGVSGSDGASEPKVWFLVVGPETEYSRGLFARHAGQPGLMNLGAVSDAVRLDALNACDCLVLPSAAEAFGIVFLEAWAVAKPVIGPRTPAVSTLIRDGENGWLVPIDDPMAIVQAVQRWIASPALARQMGESGRKRAVEHYASAHIADVVEGVYLSTSRAAPHRRPPQRGTNPAP